MNLDVHPKNLVGIHAILSEIGNGDIIDLQSVSGEGRLEWKDQSGKTSRTVHTTFPLAWLADPAQVHVVQEQVRSFLKNVQAVQRKNDTKVI